MNISNPMKRREIWEPGDHFIYEGDEHEFIGWDRTGGLHACKLAGDWIRVFESSRLWERIGK